MSLVKRCRSLEGSMSRVWGLLRLPTQSIFYENDSCFVQRQLVQALRIW